MPDDASIAMPPAAIAATPRRISPLLAAAAPMMPCRFIYAIAVASLRFTPHGRCYA